jgi:hypothetical protein
LFVAVWHETCIFATRASGANALLGYKMEKEIEREAARGFCDLPLSFFFFFSLL